MANRSPWGHDASNVFARREPERCSWLGCHGKPVHDGLPICMDHGLEVAAGMMQHLSKTQTKPDDADEWPPDSDYEYTAPEPFVYYVMLSPVTVKIGTTRHLAKRMGELRSELQYVVAIERGGLKLEHQRHKEFSDERRRPRNEEFHLSDRLKRHIESLQPQRDELLALATT